MSTPAFSVTVDLHGLDRELAEVAREIRSLPPSPGKNPLALALRYYQNVIRRRRPPKVSQDGDWFGNTWFKHAEQRVRKTDGEVIEAWGGDTKLSGKGKVKGRLRGGSRNVRVQPGSLQMKDTGDLLQEWTTNKPTFGPGNLSAFIQSKQEYAATHWFGDPDRGIPARNWGWSHRLQQVLQGALNREYRNYLQALLDKKLGRGAKR